MKLLVKNAKLREKDHLVDILIENGKFSKIDKEIKIEDNKDCETVDAQGNLVTPTFVDPHLHIDKAFTALGGRLSNTETLEEAINIMHD